ncbi:MAG: hypothetical protein P9M03_03405 [Candidatus Theseobacter exili]|nr:hypothetical protein [Candidatus Theseobacter exili]
MALFGLILNTIHESMKRKMFILFFGFSTLILILFLFVLNVDIIDKGIGTIKLIAYNDASVDLVQLVRTSQAVVAAVLFVFGILVSTLATASIIPGFQMPGYIDLVLSKPVSRPVIILGKYFGAVIIVGINVFYLVGGVWLILSAKTGIWNFGFLASGGTILVTYAIIMAVMTFLGIFTKSTVLSILIAYVFLNFMSFILVTLVKVPNVFRLLSPFWKKAATALYHFFPKLFELFAMTGILVKGDSVPDWSVLWTSVIFGVVFLGFSMLLFSRKDY